jgi:hypothetical protein
MILFIIKSYFFANVFLAGFGFHSDLDWAKKRSDYFRAFWSIILFTSFGCFIYIYAIFHEQIMLLIRNTVMRDYYLYYFTNKFTNLPENQLNYLNNSIEGKTPITFREKCICRLITKINKRNNFSYKSVEPK